MAGCLPRRPNMCQSTPFESNGWAPGPVQQVRPCRLRLLDVRAGVKRRRGARVAAKIAQRDPAYLAHSDAIRKGCEATKHMTAKEYAVYRRARNLAAQKRYLVRLKEGTGPIRRRVSEQTRREARRLRQQGYSYERIAQELGIGPTTARMACLSS